MDNECRRLIKSDLYRYIGKYTFKDLVLNYFLNEGFKYMYNHRKCNYYRKRNKIKFLLYRINLNRLKYKYGYEISSNAKIGEGFYIGHLGPIIINPKAKLGKNINFDVPDNSIVIGNPGIVKENKKATDGYLQYKI
ncbi:hypothetical protein C0L77_001417 [Clostridium perfringens]|uniref:hypothetical protein n=1 Tax=Clostridium perfringens TaxID=1502 RepID=UPI001A199EB5|nr:hypothetical protein [Clostridium perfringens]UBK69228.1 hypothetical protein KLF38_02250 [Clostridium perfringens]HAT4138291.1 hypothetical protein [Clostridium perfringens]